MIVIIHCEVFYTDLLIYDRHWVFNSLRLIKIIPAITIRPCLLMLTRAACLKHVSSNIVKVNVNAFREVPINNLQHNIRVYMLSIQKQIWKNSPLVQKLGICSVEKSLFPDLLKDQWLFTRIIIVDFFFLLFDNLNFWYAKCQLCALLFKVASRSCSFLYLKAPSHRSLLFRISTLFTWKHY